MKSRALLFWICVLVVAALGALLLPATFAPRVAANSRADHQLAPYQRDLLEVAFAAGTMLPLNPHLKNRSRLQEEAVEAWIALDQPKRALAAAQLIENWRRGTSCAAVAYYYATHGDPGEARGALDLAQKVSDTSADDTTEGEVGQGWRKDRIRAGIARTYLALGQVEQAATFTAGLASSEVGSVSTARAALVPDTGFDEQLKQQEGVLATGDFDLGRGALEACARLYDRFYADADRRARVEQAMKNSWAKLPVLLRIEMMCELTGSALGHSDKAKALELVNETQAMMDGFQWVLEDQIALTARLGSLRFQSGDEDKGRAAVGAALELFETSQDRIVDIYRAAALRSIAEAHQAMGETRRALEIYARAVEAGIANPNSRPRAEDLCATCCSMAVHSVEPGAQLWGRILSVKAGLQAPW